MKVFDGTACEATGAHVRFVFIAVSSPEVLMRWEGVAWGGTVWHGVGGCGMGWEGVACGG